MRTKAYIWVLFTMMGSTPLIVAQPTPDANKAAEATVDRIMDQAVTNIARRYNLSEEQKKSTEEIMRRRVRSFLVDHEKDVWPVIRDLLAAQLGGKPPENKEDVKRIGRAARPLSKLAEKAILEGNQEWRSLLTDDQKKMHDYDLADINKTFTEIDRSFEKWEKGEATSEPIIPTVQTGGKAPPRPKAPPANPNRTQPWTPDSDVFDAIVDKFIKDYELDPSQIESARSIVEEAKTRAGAFAESNKQQFAEIDARHKAAHAGKDHDALAAVEAERNKLLEPYHDLVAQVETRLKGLLTTAQIERHAQRTASGDAAKSKDAAANPTSRHPTPTPAGFVGPIQPQPARNKPAATP